ncbi:MAG TPA: hypothetical protein VEA16_06950 [Vicinamibacterales bacterium]|nr:hypothetical protein [Vicinamibacterales bacterium]
MAIVFSLCAAYVAYCLATNPAGPLTTPDSIHYLNTSPIVPLGYPVFLKIVGARGALIVQPVLFGAALAFLGAQIVRLTRSTALAAAVVLGTIALPQIREFHASILSESLFMSALVVFLALAIRFSYWSTWHLMVLIATAAGVSATVRRTGFALLPVMLVMVLLERRRLRGSPATLFMVAAVAPFLVIIGAEQVAAPLLHAGRSSSLMGRHMFAKAALIDAPPAPPSADAVRSALDRHLEVDYAPIRELLASAPRDIRGVLTIYYETCLQGGCADRSRHVMPGVDESIQTNTLGAAGLSRIARAPAAFVRLLARNYESLWTVDRLRHPDRAAPLTAFIASHRPLPFERLALALAPEHVLEFEPVPRVRYMQIVMTGLGWWTGGLALAGIAALLLASPLPRGMAIAAVAALTAHAGLLLTAGLAAGFSRFTIGLWPAIVTAAIFGVWSVVVDSRRQPA